MESLIKDPYAHLNDEDYEKPFAAGRVQAANLITMAGRATVSLDGVWNFVIDPHDEGLRQRWYEIQNMSHSKDSPPLDYDDAHWQTVNVPSCWNTVRPEWFHFEGSAWYSRTFDLPPSSKKDRIFLRVGAANYEARVFLNGRFMGSHQGGSTPFFIELSANLEPFNNLLQIQVENRCRADRVPMNHTDWFNYGGLYREVCLVVLPTVFIQDFHAAWINDPARKEIQFEVCLSEPIDGIAQIELPELDQVFEMVLVAGKGVKKINLDFQAWSPDNPKLYEIQVSYGTDVIRDRVGFRQIRCHGDRLLLNGEDLFLRGISVHEESLPVGKVSNEQTVRDMLRHAKELNANFIRLSHYPHHELVASIADELGILLWAEIPVYWAIDFGNPDTFNDANNQLQELIRRDRNRSSIIFWGVGNENHDTDARLGFMSRLAAAARKADDTRLISAACLINRETFQIQDRLSEVLDVIGINEYFGWYEPSFEGLSQLLNNSNPTKPVVITETGADALPGLHGKHSDRYSEESQSLILETQLKMLKKAGYIRGISPWVLYDFRTERRQNSFQRGINLKGLIASDKLHKKISFQKVSEIYADWAKNCTTPANKSKGKV
ncbi:glycoside hydrolase family 2 protein [Polynucleobacter sp.]|jgi:beta-glucuronidase|uniref:glycoside hydrolase family 2 protein n=1 Tax=Polynucleobacter sp. TaxID=2029855 RepID=UPI0037C9212A